MGTLMSGFEEIDRINFRPFPTRPTGMRKVVRTGAGIFGLGENGAVYTTSRLAKDICLIMPADNRLDETLKALVKLKLVSKETASKHYERVRKANEQRDARHVLEWDVPRIEKLGVKLTKTQRRKLEAAAGKT